MQSVRRNLILDADSYNSSDFLQLPSDAEVMSCYIAPRGGDYTDVVPFGLQAYLHKIQGGAVLNHDVEEAAAVLGAHGLPFDAAGWGGIAGALGGRLPLRIRAVPEGCVVPVGTPLAVVENTDDAYPWHPWLPNYLSETSLLRALWYPSTVATLCYVWRQALWPFVAEASDDPEREILFKVHNFGARAATSEESAQLGGLAHLVSFAGTDVVGALQAGRRFYGATMPGLSIPASKHATVTAWGIPGEADAYRRMIREFGRPNGMFSAVSDSYDIDYAVDRIWGRDLRDEVRACGAKVIIRPDSGDPVETPVRTVFSLAQSYGTTPNSKGFGVINHVGVIQGDGIGIDEAQEILRRLIALRLAPTNITFGVGGKLMQAGIDRDTMRWASKASAVRRAGEWRSIAKRPKGDRGKASKLGRLAVVRTTTGFETLAFTGDPPNADLMRPVFQDGEILVRDTLQDIRARAWLSADGFPE